MAVTNMAKITEISRHSCRLNPGFILTNKENDAIFIKRPIRVIVKNRATSRIFDFSPTSPRLRRARNAQYLFPKYFMVAATKKEATFANV